MKGYARQIIIVVLTVLMLYVCLSGGGGDFSDDGASSSVYYRYPTAFSPAPFTFAIWLPIFLGTIVLAIYQALPAQRGRSSLDRMAIPYAVALVANTLTPLVWLGLSNIIVLVLFAALVTAYAAAADPKDDRASSLCVRLPLAMFATWSGLATAVNACQFLASRGVPIEPMAASFIFIVAALVGCWALRQTGEIIIGVVLIWAGVGIAIAQPVINAALLVALVSSLCVAIFTWVQANR